MSKQLTKSWKFVTRGGTPYQFEPKEFYISSCMTIRASIICKEETDLKNSSVEEMLFSNRATRKDIEEHFNRLETLTSSQNICCRKR
jgi:hypothetical protein